MMILGLLAILCSSPLHAESLRRIEIGTASPWAHPIESLRGNNSVSFDGKQVGHSSTTLFMTEGTSKTEFRRDDGVQARSVYQAVSKGDTTVEFVFRVTTEQGKGLGSFVQTATDTAGMLAVRTWTLRIELPGCKSWVTIAKGELVAVDSRDNACPNHLDNGLPFRMKVSRDMVTAEASDSLSDYAVVFGTFLLESARADL